MLQEMALLPPMQTTTKSTPWSLIMVTQVVGLLGLSSMLLRLEAAWYDYLLVALFLVYEVFVIRSLVRRATTEP